MTVIRPRYLLGAGVLLLGVALSVALLGSAGVAAFLLPLLMIWYSSSRAVATTAAVELTNGELELANHRLRTGSIELVASAVSAVRVSYHDVERAYLDVIRACLGALPRPAIVETAWSDTNRPEPALAAAGLPAD